MRTFVVLLIAALVLVPTLAHAQSSPAAGAALVLPVGLIALLVLMEKTHPRAEGPGVSPWPCVTSVAPVVGSDR
jgi:hypothetical protein